MSRRIPVPASGRPASRQWHRLTVFAALPAAAAVVLAGCSVSSSSTSSPPASSAPAASSSAASAPASSSAASAPASSASPAASGQAITVAIVPKLLGLSVFEANVQGAKQVAASLNETIDYTASV